MTVVIDDIEVDIFQVPGGWGYWFVSPYGNVVTKRDKTSASHAFYAARLALKYYTELPEVSGDLASVLHPGEELKHSLVVKNQNLAYCAEYFDGVQKRRAIDRWATHNAYRILQYGLDPLPLPEDLRPFC